MTSASTRSSLASGKVGRAFPFVLVAFVLALAPAAFAGRGSRVIGLTDGAPATIELREFFENAPRSGWVPLAVQITNRSSSARTWTLSLETSQGITDCHLGEWSFTVPAGEQKEFTFFAPLPYLPQRANFYQITGQFSGPWIAGSGQVWFDRRFNGYPETLLTGMSMRLAAENWSRLEAELQGTAAATAASGPSHVTPSVHLSGTSFEPGEVPADWRSFAGLDTIWIHRDDWIDFTTAKRLALLRWVSQGGALYIAGLGTGLNDLPATADMRFVGAALWQSGRYGLGLITRLPLEDENSTTGKTSSAARRLPIAEVAKIITATPTLAGEPEDMPQTALEVAVGQIRTHGLFLGLVVAVIGILLGPVNLLVLAPARKRARLFITVPIIAAGGALALVALILLQDGTGGRGRRAVLVALAPDRPEALVIQEQSVLTGLLIGRSFQVPEDASFNDYSLVENNNRYAYYGRSGPYNYRPPRSGLDRDGAQLSGDWFTSRTVHSHELREFVPTRASITLEFDEKGKPFIISTCPNTLRDVYVLDGERHLWSAAQVPRGQRVPLEDRKRLAPQTLTPEIKKYFPGLASNEAINLAQPLTFQAVAERWDETVPAPTLTSIRWNEDRVFIVGPVRTKAEVEP